MKYESIYRILTQDMPKPNIIIYLHASLDTLMKRIALRGREFEKMIQCRIYGTTFSRLPYIHSVF